MDYGEKREMSMTCTYICIRTFIQVVGMSYAECIYTVYMRNLYIHIGIYSVYIIHMYITLARNLSFYPDDR